MSCIKNKSIVLIDDSLVRGTTCFKIVKMLYEAGAKEVHVKIACPEIKYPDFYIDMPSKKELLAANKNLKEMKKFIGADTLSFLSLNGLYEALCSEEIIYIHNFLITILQENILSKELIKMKAKIVSQLSFLSGKSSN